MPVALRRFVGIWSDERENGGKWRRIMLIVTRVEASGQAFGFHFFGPSVTTSFTQGPEGFFKIDGLIDGDVIKYKAFNGSETYSHTLRSSSQMRFFFQNNHGQTNSRTLDPVWTLVRAERGSAK